MKAPGVRLGVGEANEHLYAHGGSEGLGLRPARLSTLLNRRPRQDESLLPG